MRAEQTRAAFHPNAARETGRIAISGASPMRVSYNSTFKRSPHKATTILLPEDY